MHLSFPRPLLLLVYEVGILKVPAVTRGCQSDTKTVSYEEIFPGNFGVGGVKNFLGKKPRFLRGNYPAKFPRPKFPQEILARILPAEEILKPKISWRRGHFTRKFWDHLIIELKSVPFPSTG